MTELMALTTPQYLLLMNVFNLSIALFGAASLVFILLRRHVSHNYSMAVSLMAGVTAMACYHYFRIFANWQAAFTQQGAEYLPSGVAFSYAYRYADWLGTVPLLISAVILVLDLGRQKTTSLVARLGVSAALMVALGYVGEAEHVNMAARAAWGAASTLPFLYILSVLWGEVGQALRFESARVQTLFASLRGLLVASWCVYPVIYALPLLGLGGPEHLPWVQVANSAADLLAKVGTGFLLVSIAREKTEEDRLSGHVGVATPLVTAAD